MLYLAACLIAAFALVLIASNGPAVLTRRAFDCEHVTEPLTILHVSDLHGRKSAHILRMAEKLGPDVVALTGDLFSESGRGEDGVIRFVRALSAVSRVFFIPGNHEYRLPDPDGTFARLRAAGAVVLRNASYRLNIGPNAVVVAGLDEAEGSARARFHTRGPTARQAALLRALEGDGALTLVLCHYPENFARGGELSYNKAAFDLMLAGHAHGGQVVLPLVGALYAPGQGVFPKYTSGFYGARPALEVTRGAGGKWYLPRVFNRPEVVIVTVRPAGLWPRENPSIFKDKRGR